MTTILLGVALTLLLTFATAVFVGAEFSLTSIDRPRIRRLANQGDPRARGVLKALRSLSFQLSGAQLGITVAALVAGFITEPLLAQLFVPALRAVGLSDGAARAAGVAVALVVATVLLMVFGELVPKNAAIAKPLGVAYLTTPPQRLFSAVCKPLISLLDGAANRVVRALGVEPQEELRAGRSPVELGYVVRASAEQGTLDRGTASLLSRSLVFEDRLVADVLTPRTRVEALAVRDSLADLAALSRRTGYSRFPVYRETIDDVVGTVHVKTVFGYPLARRAGVPVREVCEPPILVPETLPCDELLARLRAARRHMAVVIDEYGGAAGVATLEDLVEELVGEVRDEHDLPEVPAVVADDDGWSVSGLLRDDEAAEQLGFTPPPGPYETLAGLVLDRLGRIPEPGNRVEVADAVDRRLWTLTVKAMDGHRIDRLRLTRRDTAPDDAAPDDAAPDDAAPDDAAPDGTAPDDGASDRAAPNGADADARRPRPEA